MDVKIPSGYWAVEGRKDVSFEIIEMTFLGATGQNGTYV